MTTTRLYISNDAAGYSPATVRGTWTINDTSIVKNLGAKGGTAATKFHGQASGGTWTVMVARFVSAPLTAAYAFSTSDTIEWLAGIKIDSVTNAGGNIDVFAYVTTGDSDTPRGTILTNQIGADALSTTATGRGDGAVNLTGNVSAQIGDRIVIEIGGQKTGIATAARNIIINYGNTGGTDLTEGSTSVTTEPGWIQLVTVADPWAAGAVTRRVMVIS